MTKNNPQRHSQSDQASCENFNGIAEIKILGLTNNQIKVFPNNMVGPSCFHISHNMSAPGDPATSFPN